MLTVTISVMVFALAIQFAALYGMGSRRLIGDEVEYVDRGRSEDPYAPRLFLRPPVLPWLARLCHFGAVHREPDRGTRRLRFVIAMASVVAVGLTAIAGWRIGGAPVALLSALLLALHAERVILGCHIWPDTVLATTLAALMVVSTFPMGPVSVLVASVLCTFGLLTRIDFLVVTPLVVAAWMQISGPPSAALVAILVTPPLAALVIISARNYRHYRIPLPDTTWAFNLLVARANVHLEGDDSFEIERTVKMAASTWRDLDPTETTRQGLRALKEIFFSPLRFGRGMARRLLILIGPDTFIRQKLLPANAAYPNLGERQRRWWEGMLVVTTPLLVTAAFIGTAMHRQLPDIIVLPSVGLALIDTLFHLRTRYRVAVLPALCLVSARGIVRLASGSSQAIDVVFASIGGIVLFWALLQIRYSDRAIDS